MRGMILCVDQSTSATKAFLINKRARIVESAILRHEQSYPHIGWVEQDANEIYNNALTMMDSIEEETNICAIGLTNQRETVVIWERDTGLPLLPAIVWQDGRAAKLCARLKGRADEIFSLSGLPLSPYFSAAKVAHALWEHPELRSRDICIGTMDSYLVYRLTDRKVFATDVTNASRTQLMNLRTLDWDDALLDAFSIKRSMLPAILPSDANFGEWRGIPIRAVMGDSHAGFFGHGCHNVGDTKATFGTGSSVMMNIGEQPIMSRTGLATSVGFSRAGKTNYVLEGNVTCSGDTLCWLRDELGLIDKINDIEREAAPDARGVYVVPAFAGLGAPHTRPLARGLICGLSRGSGREHILRAAVDSMAYQDADILQAMREDTGITPKELRVDGGGANNPTLQQFLADIANVTVVTAKQSELSAIGVAIMAGMSVGLKMPESGAYNAQYQPQMNERERERLMRGWRTARNKA